MALPLWVVLGAVLVCQWVTVGVVSRLAPHNGFAYYSGGDDTWYYTSAWVLGQGHIPQGYISYSIPSLHAPIAHFAGPSIVAGLPFVVALNLLVLWPIALLCVYGIAKAIGGRGFAYLACFAWTAFPLATIPYFYVSYHRKYVDQSLPSALGLVSTGDFPSMVCLLVAAYFALKAVSERSPQAALFAGVAVGFAATVKPANLIFLPAPLAALALTRRPRELLLFGAGLVPALVGLALWKYRGLGYLPAFESPPAALASGSLTPPPVGSVSLGRYLPLDWSHLWHNMLGIREFTWSLRMVTWVVVAGLIALARRSAAVGILIGGWLVSYLVLKGTSPSVDVISGSFFRYMVPAFPPFFFAIAAIPLLVPVLGRRLVAGRAQSFWPAGRRSWRALFGVAAVLTLVPILAIAAFRPLTAPSAVDLPELDQYIPANAFSLSAREEGDGSIVLTWPDQNAHGTRAGYAVFRERTDGLTCTPRQHAAALCVFYSDPVRRRLTPLGRTAATTFTDHPKPGWWVYRVVATLSPYGPSNEGNFMALSRAAKIRASAY
jgi:hypothetical protein